LNEFTQALEILKETAEKKYTQKVPWQIEYHLLLTPREEEEHAVPFYGGKVRFLLYSQNCFNVFAQVTTPDGKTVNETRCAFCTLVIQHWAQGEGDPR